nr:YshB family small membrane protein [Klebsiella pneumoniae]
MGCGFCVLFRRGSEAAGAAASHTPQTAVAAVLCAALVGLFS